MKVFGFVLLLLVVNLIQCRADESEDEPLMRWRGGDVRQMVVPAIFDLEWNSNEMNLLLSYNLGIRKGEVYAVNPNTPTRMKIEEWMLPFDEAVRVALLKWRFGTYFVNDIEKNVWSMPLHVRIMKGVDGQRNVVIDQGVTRIYMQTNPTWKPEE